MLGVLALGVHLFCAPCVPSGYAIWPRECIFCRRTGPTVWNSLPDHLRDPAVDSEQFRRDLEDVSVRNVSALEVLHNRALQIDIYLLTYLLTYLLKFAVAYDVL